MVPFRHDTNGGSGNCNHSALDCKAGGAAVATLTVWTTLHTRTIIYLEFDCSFAEVTVRRVVDYDWALELYDTDYLQLTDSIGLVTQSRGGV